MAVYRLVRVNYWQDDFVLKLKSEERFFYIYLLTCSKTTQCGIFPLPKGVAELETGFGKRKIEKLLKRFVEYGKVLYDEETQEVFLVNWVRYNPITNTNVEKCVLRELKDVKNAAFVALFLEKCHEQDLHIPLLEKQYGEPASEETPDQVGEEHSKEGRGEGEVFAFYEQNFAPLSPYKAQELASWIDDLSEELVLKALHIAHDKNKCTLAYVKGILRAWHRKGYRHLDQVREEQRAFEKKSAEKNETDSSHDLEETEKLLTQMKE